MLVLEQEIGGVQVGMDQSESVFPLSEGGKPYAKDLLGAREEVCPFGVQRRSAMPRAPDGAFSEDCLLVPVRPHEAAGRSPLQGVAMHMGRDFSQDREQFCLLLGFWGLSGTEREEDAPPTLWDFRTTDSMDILSVSLRGLRNGYTSLFSQRFEPLQFRADCMLGVVVGSMDSQHVRVGGVGGNDECRVFGDMHQPDFPTGVFRQQSKSPMCQSDEVFCILGHDAVRRPVRSAEAGSRDRARIETLCTQMRESCVCVEPSLLEEGFAGKLCKERRVETYSSRFAWWSTAFVFCGEGKCMVRVSRAVSLATLRSGRRVPNDAHSGCMMHEACASCGGTSFTRFPSRSCSGQRRRRIRQERESVPARMHDAYADCMEKGIFCKVFDGFGSRVWSLLQPCAQAGASRTTPTRVA